MIITFLGIFLNVFFGKKYYALVFCAWKIYIGLIKGGVSGGDVATQVFKD